VAGLGAEGARGRRKAADRDRAGENRGAEAPAHHLKIVNPLTDMSRQRPAAGARAAHRGSHGRRSRLCGRMSPTWIWMQVAIVVFVVIGMIVAITKLA
jgi:hypothetical protein